MPRAIIRLAAEQDASEAMTDAVRKLRTEKLRHSLRAGVTALESGQFTDVQDVDLDACLDDLCWPPVAE